MEVLRYGERGGKVRLLQLALKRAGENINIDGIFGRRTLAAVQRFQTQNGLSADGIVGRLTWAALFPYLSGYTLHIVAPGESLFSIAKRYDTTLEAIAIANELSDPDYIEPGKTLKIPLPFPVVSVQLPYDSFYTALVLEGLAARYPFLSVRSFGNSVMGRELLLASVGVGGVAVGYNASHHANEWITTPLNLLFLEDYLKAIAYQTDIGGVSASELYSKTVLHMAPLVNPDGVDLVTGAIGEGDSYYEQARALASYYPSIPFPSGWKANIRGVDLNLGYPAGWETAKRIKFMQGYTRPGPRDYVGTAPLAEPENQAMAALTVEQDYALTIAYHTQGGEIYWQFLDYRPEGAERIGEAMAAASGYRLAETPYNSSFAGYKDWFIQTYIRPGYTIEAGRGQNPLPLSQLEQMYRDNLGVFVAGLNLSS
ncbi:MAG: M14 family zinc carboxypeptidase [Clostridia bacterium]|nr:M14 family zinc carboxypeptidase [Clostridia bacterium]